MLAVRWTRRTLPTNRSHAFLVRSLVCRGYAMAHRPRSWFLGTVAFLTLLATREASLLRAEEPLARQLQGSFIWSPSVPTGQQAYVVFRKTFSLPEAPVSAALHLFADSRYLLWINGQYVERGPCRFLPAGPEYDTLDVTQFLRPGENVLAVLVHHYHDGKPAEKDEILSGRILRHAPGLTALLQTRDSQGNTTTWSSDASWRVCPNTRFGPSGFQTVSSLSDNIDARRDPGDWTAPAFDDSTWETAAAINGNQWGPLRARRTPRLRETEIRPLFAIQRTHEGVCERLAQQAEAAKPELASMFPLEMATGDELVIDAGRFVQAYSEVTLEAEEGSQLELRYAQRFFVNGKPEGMPSVEPSRYTARQGRQVYTSGDTFGCKYVVLRCTAGSLRLLQFRLVNRLYPFDVVGAFRCSDRLLNDLWQIGVNTILTCSEDAYVDCATRERDEWLGDGVLVSYPISRLTMAGPRPDGSPYWSDPRLLGNLLRHIGQSTYPDGRVKARPPEGSDIHSYIEDYACLWIQGLRTWLDNTGDLELVREMWPVVQGQLQWFLERRTERGLVRAREFVFPNNPLGYQVCEGTTLNAFVVRALADASLLAQRLGDPAREREYAEASRSLREALNAQLWDEAAGTYSGGIKEETKTAPTLHAAVIALYFEVVPPERRPHVERWVLANLRTKEKEFQPFQYAYAFEVLARMHSDEADRQALDVMRRRWAKMTTFETKTTWEGFGPDECCHDMGSPPTLYLSRHVLGIGVEGPVAERRLAIEPHLGDLESAEGIVVTEFGPVPVQWNRSANGNLRFALEIPAGVQGRLALPLAPQHKAITVDDRPVEFPDPSTPHAVTLELGEGKHQGEARGL